MKKCQHCKGDVPNEAKKCQHCAGHLQSWPRRHWILTCLLVFILLPAFINTVKNYKPSTPVNLDQVKEEEVIKLSASELYNAYKRNEIDADARYKDKILEISGVIANIGKDITDEPYVTFKTGELFSSDVQCMLADSEVSKASQLQKGQNITLRGKLSGKLMNIFLRNCIIK